ncbi:MAG: hypothetical protein JEY96_03065 [Bacteroidales bacterium]|nr:hypothetical protein [Bacteroidales bacterium]
MKRLAIVFVLVLFAIVSFGQTDNKSQIKKTTDPSKKETVKTVPKTTQKKTQIKKAQIKKAQIQNKKKKQIIRKSKAIRRKRKG